MKQTMAASIAASALWLQACNGSSSSVPVVPPAQTLFASNDTTPGAVALFRLPISPTTVPSGALTGLGNIPQGMCVGPSGVLVVSVSNTSEIQAWTAPANGGSPSFSVSVTGSPTDCAFDSAGNLYVALQVGQIAVYPTFHQGSSAGTSISSGVSGPRGVTTDAAGDVFVSNASNITEYSPLASGNTLLHTFGTVNNSFGIMIGPDGNLYVANGTVSGKVDVYVPPFTNSSAVDHQISPPDAANIDYFAFDRSGNLYISAFEPPSTVIYVYAPPYTGTPSEFDYSPLLGLAIE